MAGREERCELVRDGLVVLGSGVLLLGGLLVSNGLLDGLKPMLQQLPSAVGMVGGTLPDAVSSVTGNWLANPTYNRFAKICARFAGEPTTQPVLWEALSRAYTQALVEIEAELRETANKEGWSRKNRDTITQTVQRFREDVDWLMVRLPHDPGLAAPATLQTATMEDLIAQIETPDQSRLQRDWRDKFGAYLTQLEESQIQPGVHDRYLVSYISNTLPTRLTACFVRELQTNQETFQTFSHLIQVSSQQTLLSLQVGQEAIEANLAQLATAIQGLTFQDDDFARLLERVQGTLQREILTALARVTQQLGALTALTKALHRDVGQLHDDMVEQTEAIRGDIGKLGEQLRDVVAPPQRALPTAALGPRHRLFGREAAIGAALAGLRASQTVAIYGMTGVGKTALAVEVAYQRRQELGDALGLILLRDLGIVDLAGLCDAIALHCNDTAIRELPPAQKPVATRRLLASYLPPQDDRQILLIMDNLASTETAHLFLTEVRPPNLPTLITSQDRAINQEVEVSLHLYELTPERAPGEAVALMRNRARVSSGADTAIAEVTRLLGYHPLALVIAAGQIAVEGVAPGQLARRLATASVRLGLAAGNDRERSVRVALQVAWEALSPEEQHLLTRLALCPATTTTVPFLALVAAQDEGECTRGVGQLVRRSLAERLPDEHDNERVSLHQLVRDFGLQLLGAQHDEAESALLTAASECNTPCQYQPGRSRRDRG